MDKKDKKNIADTQMKKNSVEKYFITEEKKSNSKNLINNNRVDNNYLTNIKTDKNIWLGLLCKVLSCVMFAAISINNKFLLKNGLNFTTITLWNMIFGSILAYPFFVTKGNSWLCVQKKMIKFHILRTLVVACANIFLALSISKFSVLLAIVIGFFSPILNLIGSRFILKEKISISLFMIVTFSFFAGIYIADFSSLKDFLNSENSNFYIIVPIASSVLFAINNILVRYMTVNGESSKILGYQGIIFSIPFLIIPTFIFGEIPSLYHFPFLIIGGVVLVSACILHNYSYQYARMIVIAPFGFIRIVAVGILANFIMGEPCNNNIILIGTIVICINFLIVLIFEIKNKKIKL